MLTVKEDLATYAYDGTTTWSHAPEVVVLPTSVEQISAILKLANENRIPVTPRGSGTNISGGSIPVRGGIVLCTIKMNRILDINKANLTATVEPGVVLQDFNTCLSEGKFILSSRSAKFPHLHDWRNRGGKFRRSVMRQVRCNQTVCSRIGSCAAGRLCNEDRRFNGEEPHRLRSGFTVYRLGRNAWDHHKNYLAAYSQTGGQKNHDGDF